MSGRWWRRSRMKPALACSKSTCRRSGPSPPPSPDRRCARRPERTPLAGALRLDAIAGAAVALVDLVQLDHVAARIVHEDLQRFGIGEALDLPVGHAQPVELD